MSRTRPAHTYGLVSLDVEPSGKRVLYNSLEGLTCLWNIDSGSLEGKFESYVRSGSESSEPSWSVSLNPRGATYASTGGTGNVTIHSAEPASFGERRATLSSGRNKFGMYCKYAPDGSRIAMSSESGQIYIFDAASSSLLVTYSSHAMAVRSLAWSADSQLLLSASEDKRLILHDVRASPSGKPGSGAVATLAGHSSWVLSTDISPDGRLAVSGSADKTVKTWDLAARAAVSTIQDTGEVWSVAWRPRPSGQNAAGSFYAAGKPADYLAYLSSSPITDITYTAPPTPTLISLYQLSNLYLLFALNEHLVLSSTSNRRIWCRLLFCLLIADFGHLATMIPLAQEKGFTAVFVDFARWTAMEWGSVGFVYAGAATRISFLVKFWLRGDNAGLKED
ncbi:uncharacterized protein FIBRA_02325 [Fibroporia radiculosa]|uniref:DUF7704 domain-containing protein n=1 Tax=Fibroporia radiculosa TaxID=599839 RepID=J4GMT0_9APHY|nr:uncharacterized protein FIBRA_02325 [Fibroporia radiculosa]CCM00295.1 predicted protein [Fibroporia radiculosa]